MTARSRCPLSRPARRLVAATWLCVVALTLGSVAAAAPSRSGEGAAPATAAPPDVATKPTLDTMLARFAKMPGLSARFHEEKKIALLAVPLESDGEILFAPPDVLVRRVTAPVPSVAKIAAGQLTLVSGGKREQIDLAQNAVVRGFIEAFQYVLAGDRQALERTFRLRFEASPASAGDGPRGAGDERWAWRLELRPKGAPLDQFLSTLVLEGHGRIVQSMRMVEASGDVTTTTFSEVDTDKRWTPAERARRFSTDEPTAATGG